MQRRSSRSVTAAVPPVTTTETTTASTTTTIPTKGALKKKLIGRSKSINDDDTRPAPKDPHGQASTQSLDPASTDDDFEQEKPLASATQPSRRVSLRNRRSITSISSAGCRNKKPDFSEEDSDFESSSSSSSEDPDGSESEYQASASDGKISSSSTEEEEIEPVPSDQESVVVSRWKKIKSTVATVQVQSSIPAGEEDIVSEDDQPLLSRVSISQSQTLAVSQSVGIGSLEGDDTESALTDVLSSADDDFEDPRPQRRRSATGKKRPKMSAVRSSTSEDWVEADH